MQLRPVEYVDNIDAASFNKRYLLKSVPVIIKDFLTGSMALEKWSFTFFKELAGEINVSVYGPENAHPDKAQSQPATKMKFSEYLDRIEAGPTESRLFLFNLLLERPELRKDIRVKKLTPHILTSLPFMFFGGAGSGTRNHYDIDMSHVFLSQFMGEKKVYLFSNDQSPLLYKLPYNFHGIADLRNPDFEKFPGLKYLQGWECIIKPGETLFMPAGYWHYIQYLTSGYSVSHRAISPSFTQRVIGLRNLILTRNFDNAMRKIRKEKWFEYKVHTAFKRAEHAIMEKSR